MLICPLYFYYIYAAKLHQNRKSTPYQRFNHTPTLKKAQAHVAQLVDMSHTPAYRRPPTRCPSIGCGVSWLSQRGGLLSPADLLPQHTHGDQHVEPPDIHLLAHTDLNLPRASP